MEAPEDPAEIESPTAFPAEPLLSEPPPPEEHEEEAVEHGHRGFWALVLGSLGVVFGDIGTSPLYALQECVHGSHAVDPTRDNLFGILSLIFWSMTLVVTGKYVLVLLRADNRGEGGIMALLALVPEALRRAVRGRVALVSLMVIMGASLLFGDGIITPSISVMSAVEGLAVAEEGLGPYVVPITCLILAVLFAVQHRGTGALGGLFGPVVLVWFVTLAVLGISHIARAPEILGALSPHHSLRFFLQHGYHAFTLLGSVVLVVTGGEALYADMGHFGRKPIQAAWLGVTFPCLMLCYLGQGALLLHDPEAKDRVFFSMVPQGPLTFALVLLATAATVIASQALISAIFSLTHQAIRLGYLPRVAVYHTSSRIRGQIYVPVVNWGLGFSCLLLVLVFQHSSRLAAAYGLAVSATMALTSVVFYHVMRHAWGWTRGRSLLMLCAFLAIDLPFLAATSLKFVHGGYVPVVVGLAFFAVMVIWIRGRCLLAEYYADRTVPLEQFLGHLQGRLKARIPGLGVVMASPGPGTPPVLVHVVKRFKVLHERVFLLTVTSEPVPRVPHEDRVKVEALGHGFHRVMVHCGFTEHPNVPRAVRQAQSRLLMQVPHSDVVYLINHETFVATDAGLMSRHQELVFAFLARNAVDVSQYFGIPPEQVVELGSRIDL
ncbi:MAG: KUP/HAK/KT family potassium transporter [Candidatus Eremiobacterota bacterium]